MDTMDGVKLAIAFGSGIAVAWFSAVARIRGAKQVSDDERVVEWARLLGSMEASMSGLCVKVDAIDGRLRQLDGVPAQLDGLSRAVTSIQSKLARQAAAFDEHSREETQILRELKLGNGG